MKAISTIVLLFVCSALMAQPETESLKTAIAELNTALIKKDTVRLKNLLHDGVTYGHSNGWIETKREMVVDLFNHTLEYEKIDQTEPEIVMEGTTAAVRADAAIVIKYHDEPVEMELHILQVWVKTRAGWKLIGRQSVKA